jgi:hypothetical protein
MKARRTTAALVDTIQWTGNNLEDVQALLHVAGRAPNIIPQAGKTLLILTHTGSVRAAPDDWVIRDPEGVVSVCPASAFVDLYTLVEEPAPEKTPPPATEEKPEPDPEAKP